MEHVGPALWTLVIVLVVVAGVIAYRERKGGNGE